MVTNIYRLALYIVKLLKLNNLAQIMGFECPTSALNLINAITSTKIKFSGSSPSVCCYRFSFSLQQ